MEPITIHLPIHVPVSKKTNFALNLNVYRNANFHILNKAKVEFGKMVEPLIQGLPPMSSLSLTYRLFFGSKRSVDTANVCCIVDKFFSDTLVNAMKIPDDNHEIVKDINYRFGGIDPQNPRIEVTIHDYEIVEPKEEPVRIILVQTEIEAAIKSYVLGQIQLKEGQEVSIDFKNTRGDDGATAEINIGVAAGGSTKTSPLPATNAPKLPETPVKTPQATTPVQPAAETSKQPTAASTAPVATQTAIDEAPVVTPTNGTSVPVTANSATETAPAVGANAPAGSGKSLFANLTKPDNSKPSA